MARELSPCGLPELSITDYEDTDNLSQDQGEAGLQKMGEDSAGYSLPGHRPDELFSNILLSLSSYGQQIGFLQFFSGALRLGKGEGVRTSVCTCCTHVLTMTVESCYSDVQLLVRHLARKQAEM